MIQGRGFFFSCKSPKKRVDLGHLAERRQRLRLLSRLDLTSYITQQSCNYHDVAIFNHINIDSLIAHYNILKALSVLEPPYNLIFTLDNDVCDMFFLCCVFL